MCNVCVYVYTSVAYTFTVRDYCQTASQRSGVREGTFSYYAKLLTHYRQVDIVMFAHAWIRKLDHQK